MPQSNYWTDPAGQRHAYANTSGGLRGGAARALERERTWSAADPSYDSSEFAIQNGQIVKDGSTPWWLAPVVLGGPLAGALLPGMWAGSGAAGTAATGGGAGAASAGAAGAAGSAAVGGLRGLLTDPNTYAGLAGVIAALSGGGGNGQASEEARRLNQITEQRMRRVDPLHQAVTQLAWNRLPMNARSGITPPTYNPLG